MRPGRVAPRPFPSTAPASRPSPLAPAVPYIPHPVHAALPEDPRILAPEALLAPLTPLQQLWAYITLGASPIVTEELAPLLGGLAASQRQLHLSAVITSVTIGGWVATTLLYVLGRWRGRWLRRRFPQTGDFIKRTLRAVRRRPWRSALAVRFAFGARLLLPLACGAAHMRLDVYLIGTLISSAVWSTLFAYVGFWFGEAAVAGLERVREYDQYVGVVVVGLGLASWWWWRRRRARRTAPRAAARHAP
jgi:membrane protein DedA with SNARE-associated domain